MTLVAGCLLVDSLCLSRCMLVKAAGESHGLVRLTFVTRDKGGALLACMPAEMRALAFVLVREGCQLSTGAQLILLFLYQYGVFLLRHAGPLLTSW
jgi:hypothetical protein